MDQSCPLDKLRKHYCHLQGVPLQPFSDAKPLILIGADNQYFIIPTERVRFGPPRTPVVLKTRQGWALQGPTCLHKQSDSMQCLFTSTKTPYAEHSHNVKKAKRPPQPSYHPKLQAQQPHTSPSNLLSHSPLGPSLRYTRYLYTSPSNYMPATSHNLWHRNLAIRPTTSPRFLATCHRH